jgi:hypothetical protein
MGGSRSVWVGNDAGLAAISIRAGKILAHWALTQVLFPELEELVQVMLPYPACRRRFLIPVQELQTAFEQAAVKVGIERAYEHALDGNYRCVHVPLPLAPAKFSLT